MIASNRGDQLRDFMRVWHPFPWDATVVVEDGPAHSFDFPAVVVARNGGCGSHLAWPDVDAEGPAVAAAISRCDSGIKSYGFYRAIRDWQADVVISLDDDCYPLDATDDSRRAFVAGHLSALAGGPAWVPIVPGLSTRGIPYGDLGSCGPTQIHVGLWSDVADFDAPQSLHRLRHDRGSLRGFTAPAGVRLMHPRQYWPLVGMNLSFRARALPLLYFPKMGLDSPYARFDDIWCGVIAQKACRHLDWLVSAGEPHVRHIRASDPMVNLTKEAPGIRANEEFWAVINSIPLTDSYSTPLGVMTAIGRNLAGTAGHGWEPCPLAAPGLADYLTALGGHILAWCKLVEPLCNKKG